MWVLREQFAKMIHRTLHDRNCSMQIMLAMRWLAYLGLQLPPLLTKLKSAGIIGCQSREAVTRSCTESSHQIAGQTTGTIDALVAVDWSAICDAQSLL